MTKRYPHGVPCWIDLAPPDLAAARAFYSSLFGWELDGDGTARLNGGSVAGIGDPIAGAGWTTFVGVDDLDATLARVNTAGGAVLAREPTAAVVADRQGATLVVAQDHREAERVNGDGCWNWSTLATRDPEGAQAFYGEVLGWRFSDPGFGATMAQVPGYGELLAERDPDLRARHAQPGVPAGFSDAVAWIQPGEVSAWAVTFSVADTDAISERARELGADVLVEPFDAGPARIAELRDSRGAAFTVSAYASHR